jgi:hypothetical protein
MSAQRAHARLERRGAAGEQAVRLAVQRGERRGRTRQALASLLGRRGGALGVVLAARQEQRAQHDREDSPHADQVRTPECLVPVARVR